MTATPHNNPQADIEELSRFKPALDSIPECYGAGFRHWYRNYGITVKEALTIADRQAGVEDSVPYPTHEDQAALMVLLGHKWLLDNAPHRLTQQGRAAKLDDAQSLENMRLNEPNYLLNKYDPAWCIGHQHGWNAAIDAIIERGKP